MGIGPGPGETYKVECGSNDSSGVGFVGEGVSIVLDGDNAHREYYEVGKSYIFHARPVDSYKPDGGTLKKSPR
jgi:hypothetical protein